MESNLVEYDIAYICNYYKKSLYISRSANVILILDHTKQYRSLFIKLYLPAPRVFSNVVVIEDCSLYDFYQLLLIKILS